MIESQPSTGLTFGHADGTRYGGEAYGETAERNAQLFGALLARGFKERQAHTALDRCSKVLPPGVGLRSESAQRFSCYFVVTAGAQTLKAAPRGLRIITSRESRCFAAFACRKLGVERFLPLVLRKTYSDALVCVVFLGSKALQSPKTAGMNLGHGALSIEPSPSFRQQLGAMPRRHGDVIGALCDAATWPETTVRAGRGN